MPIIICTGSRDLTDREHVWATLDRLDAESGQTLIIRVGDWYEGLDVFVQEWARSRWMIAWRMRCKVYEADWKRFGKRAGPIRDAAMVDDGADECHAWFAPPPALNQGTTITAAMARKAKIRVVEYGRETRATDEYEQETLPL